MKLTRASSYALHAVAYMATHKNDNKPMASHKIAEARGIPERFLLKVLKPLVSARILMSIKGPNGGYKLARDTSDITMLEIVEAVDGGPILGQAPPPEVDRDKFPDFNIDQLKPLYNKLENVCKKSADLVRENLDKVRLSDLLSGRRS
jgi:Rrf2 family protein